MPSHRMRSLMGTFVLGATLLVSSTAWAGEVKFGNDPLATDESGKLTDAGRKAATETIASEPGEEVWNVDVWAKIDKGAPGPLYFEFYGKTPDGKPYLAFRHEHNDYEGDKFVTTEMTLEGNSGFNKGHTYNVKVTQILPNGKPIELADGKITLQYTAPSPESKDEEEDEDGEDEDEEKDTAAQDELDTLGGNDGEAPPPIEDSPSKKKGCAIDGEGYGFSGVAVLFGLGLAAGRRRRTKRA